MNSPISGVRFALALGLCLAAAAPAAAAESAAQPEAAAKAAGLDIVEGRAYGVLDEQPLDEVLGAFARAMDMVYEVAEPLGGEPLSGRLDGLPVGEALIDLLRHFDYTAVWRADGTIERLKVTSLRSAYREVTGGVGEGGAPAAPGVQSAEVSIDQEVWQEETPLAGLSWEEQVDEIRSMDLEALARDSGVPIEQFYRPSPDGDEGEPELDIAVIENLLQQLSNQDQ